MKYAMIWGAIAFAQVTLAGSDVDSMRERIQTYHGESGNDPRVLNLVYFHPNDVEPLPAFRERIHRMMDDIQDFYRTGMEQNGFGEVVFPLERIDGVPRIHVVKGGRSNDAYDHPSGPEIVEEIAKELEGTLDLERNFVLIFHGLCDKRDDGSYFFHAPYYGDGTSNHRRGLCHVADCDVLDPRFLKDTNRKITYLEHTGTFTQSLAEFNVKYLGGVAHELGHGLSLPHNGQTPEQRKHRGTALMGAGNHTYRREVRGGQGSFLSLASATRLASHPLFTRSTRGAELAWECRIEDLAFKADDDGMEIQGQIDANPEVYAVIAYVDPLGGSDYDALATVAPVRDGRFTLPATCPKRGEHELRLVACHVNGATSDIHRDAFTASWRRKPDVASLSVNALLSSVEQAILQGRSTESAARARKLLSDGDTPAAARPKLQHVLVITSDPLPPISPAATKGDKVHVSDLEWNAARVAWGRPTRDQYFHDERIRDGLFLEPGGTFFAKGLYAHAPSRYGFALDGHFRVFTATVGLQKGVSRTGALRYLS